jgi:hypothetical protein
MIAPTVYSADAIAALAARDAVIWADRAARRARAAFVAADACARDASNAAHSACGIARAAGHDPRCTARDAAIDAARAACATAIAASNDAHDAHTRSYSCDLAASKAMAAYKAHGAS